MSKLKKAAEMSLEDEMQQLDIKLKEFKKREELLTFQMFKTMFFNKLHEILHTQEMHGNSYDGYIEGELINIIFNEMEKELS
jgi:hypothetical protein